MQWETLDNGECRAAGREHYYLTMLSTDADGAACAVVLTRYRQLRGRDVRNWSAVSAAALRSAAEAARTAIRFPFGRGPGRPGGVTDGEVESMFAYAQEYAEAYEAGQSLEGYPEWTYDRLPTGFPERYPSGADTQMTGTGELGDDAAFEITYRPGDANDCRHC